ncbi:MAG: OadG family protein [Victivallales bacterium]|nr:OadG family protein [Victivallales bacterium]MCF7889458.1 OadG family protein [Victivallales bacterium]
MIAEGFKLMVAGMGTVFIFLALMIIIMVWLEKILKPFSGILEKKQPFVKSAGRVKSVPAKEDKSLITAIVSAVHQYRKDKTK